MHALNFAKARQIVIPAEAGIQSFQDLLDSRFRGNDNARVFFKGLKYSLSHRF